jgi:hypothetical protein
VTLVAPVAGINSPEDIVDVTSAHINLPVCDNTCLDNVMLTSLHFVLLIILVSFHFIFNCFIVRVGISTCCAVQIQFVVI